MKEKVLSVRTLFDVEDNPQPDNLGAGDAYVIKIKPSAEFKRGLLMMNGTEGYFVPATRDGVKFATELCILAEDLGYEVEEKEQADETITVEEYTTAIAYFGGKFNPSAIVLDYETEDDNHDELIEEVRDYLRAFKINI